MSVVVWVLIGAAVIDGMVSILWHPLWMTLLWEKIRRRKRT